MLIKYGDFILGAPGSVNISTSAQTEVSPQTGRPLTVRRTANLNGTLKTAEADTAAAQADIKAKTEALLAAFSVWNQNLVLYQDSGEESAVVLKAAGSLTGVQVINPPTFPADKWAHHGTYVKWQCTLQAVYPWQGGLSPADLMLSFSEQLTFTGGGPQRRTLPGVNGINARVEVYPMLPHTCVQSGSAVGLRAYPKPPDPIYPDLLDDAPQVVFNGPRQEGLMLRDFGINWSYTMTAVNGRLPDALPHYWKAL